MSETINYQRDFNKSTEKRFYSLEERMERYDNKINRLMYIQFATILIIILANPQVLALLKIIGL